MAGWRSAGFSLLSVGLLSVLSGVLACFPGGTNRPWFIGWDTRTGAPLWTGTLATAAGVSVVMANRHQTRKSLWETVYCTSVLCALTSPLMFAVAMAAVLTGPLCYYSYLGAVATGYLSHAVRYPYPYRVGPGLCLDPAGAEWYHLGLCTADLLASAAIFIISLCIIVILTTRLLRTGRVGLRARNHHVGPRSM